MKNTISTVFLAGVFFALISPHAATAETHKVYGKKLISIKSCSNEAVKISAYKDEAGNHVAKQKRIQRFDVFEVTDDVVKFRMAIGDDAKNVASPGAGNYVLKTPKNMRKNTWRFRLSPGSSC
ncbi:MAG: hypothetical protein AAFX54_03070 [Pseudomonadota bacterium]